MANAETTGGEVVPLLQRPPQQLGRPAIKFTPERMEQIRNLCERGLSPEQIAETIGTTVGSLRVMCSRFGISLNRQRHLRMVRMNQAPVSKQGREGENGTPTQPLPDDTAVSFLLSYNGRQRVHKLPLSEIEFSHLCIMAEFADVTVGEMIANILRAAVVKSQA